jgi:glycerophosphoryl diester phosphodiesterase
MVRPLVVAHQGGDGIYPGNTLYAFQHAAALGVDVIETDLRQTKDGVLVISHDESVERISNGTGRIPDLTYAELQKLDAGYNWSADGGKTFPFRGQGISYTSLEAVFKALPEMHFNIDMKQTEPPIAENFCNLIRKYNMDQKVLSASFSHTNNVQFRKLCPEVTSSGDETETIQFVVLNFLGLGRLYSPEFAAFQVPLAQSGIPVVTQAFIDAAHERNVRVDVWTIDDPAEMRRLINMNVDSIITDRPDLLLQVTGE